MMNVKAKDTAHAQYYKQKINLLIKDATRRIKD